MAQIHKWIAIGTPTGLETGDSDADPYLVHNADEFDHIMRDILFAPGGYFIQLGEGVFFTRGLRRFAGTGENVSGNLGWYVRSHWTISGSGEGLTIIKLSEWPSFVVNATPGTSPKWSVIGSLSLVSN